MYGLAGYILELICSSKKAKTCFLENSPDFKWTWQYGIQQLKNHYHLESKKPFLLFTKYDIFKKKYIILKIFPENSSILNFSECHVIFGISVTWSMTF